MFQIGPVQEETKKQANLSAVLILKYEYKYSEHYFFYVRVRVQPSLLLLPCLARCHSKNRSAELLLCLVATPGEETGLEAN